ncbi:hypothetical protein CYMTET_9527 [Cymbomonas tetramitiformis]|uniref:Uncharacterized protein n=1 Tax=Cymbomonas tetramitiformis TaxID=36881 RepID=A0AAE0GRA6_9CHLO|nr:hypothetical protein CYMTET_9527 [Cymbomonas tetramitiformis]
MNGDTAECDWLDSAELKSLILKDLLEGDTEDTEDTEDTGDKDAPAPSSAKDKGVEEGKGKGKAVEGEEEEKDGEAEAQAQAAISEYAYVQQMTPLEIGDVACLMACGGGWEVEAEEKRWEAYSGGDGFEETVWYSEEKPHRPLLHTPLVTAMVLDNVKGTKVKHLEEEVEGSLPDGWVSLKVLEAHWTVLDPDLLPHATAAMQALLATETAEKLGV